MGKKLLLLPLWILLYLPATIWGQCPTSVGVNSSKGLTICQGEEVTFTANPNGGLNPIYEWTLNGVAVGSTATYTTTSLNNQDKIRVRVSSSSESGCSTQSEILTISVNPIRVASAVISASNTSICPGETVNFTISNQSNIGGGSLYEWRVNGNSQGTGNTFSSSGLVGNDEVQLWVDSSVPCTDPILSNTIIIQEKPGTPAQPGTISGNNNICPNTSQTYSVGNVTDASEYIWTLPSGWSGTSNSNTITITSGPSGGNISVQAKNSCGTGPSQSSAITVLAGTPATPGTISGPTSVCPGISADYSIDPIANADEYVWTLPDGTEQVTNVPNITVTTNNSGNSNIAVKARNSCGTSAARTLSVSVKAGKPATPGTISGSASVCPGISQTYSVAAVTGATSYTWTLPNGWTGTSTTRTITVTSGTTGGDIIVTAENDCAISDPGTLSVTVKDGTPATPGIVSGATAVCPGTTESYNIDPVSGCNRICLDYPR